MMDTEQLQLFDNNSNPIKANNLEKWPKLFDFPLNVKTLQDHNVEFVIKKDLEATNKVLIITGFTSLSYLIDTFGNNDYPHIKEVIVVLGFEPNVKGRKRYHTWPLEKEIKEYWLKKGLSILSGGSVMNLLQKIKNRWIKFYFYERLHAKIYLFDNYSLLGSSNFSSNGLNKQKEANVRINKLQDKDKYEGIKLIANNFLKNSRLYTQIEALLEDLIQEVDWKDALARAMSEILEGDWLEEYHLLQSKLNNTSLWPTQKRGLAQAITILQQSNNVLIADPTGAGKTKMCAAIILALKNWLYETGRGNKEDALIVCPPLVINKWQNEFSDLSTVNNNQVSNGILSSGGKKEREKAFKNINNTNILAIDEAHNYLNKNSKRSNAIRKNNADFKLLITATPINKKVEDLLTIIELLDIDNLEDESFILYEKLKYSPSLNVDSSINQLRQFISRFTLRRTKEIINKQIDQEPEKYRNALGEICRFPQQVSKVYNTDETKSDIKIVEKINELCKKIKGVTYLKTIDKPSFDIDSDEDKTKHFNHRLLAAKSLSIYMIRSRLRSSNVALIEHILGLQEVKKFKEFKVTKSGGNKIKVGEIEKLINRDRLPIISKVFDEVEKPDWLRDLNEYKRVCIKEKKLYEQIAYLTKQMSGQRELGKVKHLINQATKHNKSIAFDSCVITLNYFKSLIKNLNPNIRTLVATGSNKSESERVIEKFSITSKNTENIIALCSDKMSEGVDLQLASSITLLDLPSVIRIVEQRFGRIDRMDTNHKSIELFWPNDSDSFSLNGDKRLIELNEIVSNIWGANFQAPEELKQKHFQSVDKGIDTIIEEFNQYVKSDLTWDGIQDSFQSILDLKDEKKGLISEVEYQQYCGMKTSVKTKVSFLKTEEEWCFFAIRGNKIRSPKWYFIKLKNNKIYTEFQEICDNLRNHISSNNERIPWNDKYLKKYLNLLHKKEFELLPPKKRRALKVAEFILNKKIKTRKIDIEKRMLMQQLFRFFNQKNKAIDLELFAELWVEKLQPYIDEKRTRYKTSRKVYNLNSLKTKGEIDRINFSKNELQKMLDNLPVYEKIDNKISACIVGVPKI